MIVGARTTDLMVAGVRTLCVEAGSGDKVIVLLHGGGFDYRASTTAADWAVTIPDLVNRFGYHVHAFDLLGSGGTDGPAADDQHTMTAVIDHAWQTITALGIRRCAIVGHSRGGLVATSIALDHPKVVAELVLIGSNILAGRDPLVSPDFLDHAYREPGRVGTVETLRRIMELNIFESTPATEYLLARKVQRLENAHPSRPQDETAVARLLDVVRRFFVPDMAAHKVAMCDRIRRGGLQPPTLLVWGLNDPSAPLKVGIDLYQLIGMNNHDTCLHVFNRSGHWSHVEHPDDFVDVLHSFLERRPSSTYPRGTGGGVVSQE